MLVIIQCVLDGKLFVSFAKCARRCTPLIIISVPVARRHTLVMYNNT
jgi:hypothetical protein